MRLVIVTGMSGAGKTAALKMLEDMGFYCVDNLPIPLVGKFAELVQSSSGEVSCAALGIDVRSGDELAQLEGTLNDWIDFHVIYRCRCYLRCDPETPWKQDERSDKSNRCNCPFSRYVHHRYEVPDLHDQNCMDLHRNGLSVLSICYANVAFNAA